MISFCTHVISYRQTSRDFPTNSRGRLATHGWQGTFKLDPRFDMEERILQASTLRPQLLVKLVSRCVFMSPNWEGLDSDKIGEVVEDLC